MPTAQEVGRKASNDLEAALKRSEAVVEVVAGELGRMAADAGERARIASRAVSQVQADLQELLSADTLPDEFTGVIHDYRFGMFEPTVPATSKEAAFRELKRKVNKQKAKPTHRFEVEVPGAGLWLHVRCSSQDFEEFLMNAGDTLSAEDGTLDPNVLNGMTVTVKRDIEGNRLVPIGLGTISASPTPLGKDKSGNELFKGDMVKVKKDSYFDARSFKATVLDFKNNTWTLQRKDRKNPTQITTASIKSYSLFEKIDKDGKAVTPPTPPGRPPGILITGTTGLVG